LTRHKTFEDHINHICKSLINHFVVSLVQGNMTVIITFTLRNLKTKTKKKTLAKYVKNWNLKKCFKYDRELLLINLVKRKVLSFFLNNKIVLDRRISKGTVLQIFVAYTEKALSPYALVLHVGCISGS